MAASVTNLLFDPVTKTVSVPAGSPPLDAVQSVAAAIRPVDANADGLVDKVLLDVSTNASVGGTYRLTGLLSSPARLVNVDLQVSIAAGTSTTSVELPIADVRTLGSGLWELDPLRVRSVANPLVGRSGAPASGTVGPLANSNTSTTTTSTTTSTSTTVPAPTTTQAISPCVFGGFFQPVDNSPIINQVKAGSSVPVKFTFCPNGDLAIFASGSPSSASHVCGTGPIDPVPLTVATSGPLLKFDPATGRYQFNWNTDKTWTGQCRKLTLTFKDGSTASAEFKFA